ncbi:helix-turn-helix domain-containing protein [Hymenobacter rigui]|uniref:HTH cro/C1-type domain-containing protein n=1 Tax=Hymenobacter rigui TaxID=334424 RepID=A0A3R9P6Z8_9BACT|nr:helix-turn-helix transcriptional regulator [Hymenobacter rigui]RSK50143.1 hypothetical protein EI291_05680 [Hymenobacter rigui]
MAVFVYICINNHLDMNESSTVGQRIAQLIQQLGLSKNAFAISLDKTATVIQHLVEERNKPGFDLLCKIFEVYPNVSKDWLMQGEGTMWNSTESVSSSAKAPEATTPATPTSSATAPVAPAVEAPAEPAPQTPAVPATALEPAPLPTPAAQTSAPLSAASSSISEPAAASIPVVAAPPVSDAGAWQTALYTQQMAHQLALAELRNQHMQEQQRLMQQMMDLMQRQLAK